MATDRQEALKEGTIQGAAERLAALRESQMAEAEDIRDGNRPVAEEAVEETVEEVVEEIEAQPEPEPDVAPSEEEDDLFADELMDADTHTLDAPAALSKEGKELFSQLSPELQKEVEERIKAAERGATQKVQQAAQKEREIEQAAEQVLKMREELGKRLQSLDVNLPEPPDPDMADPNSDKYDPDRFNVDLARYERAKRQVEVRKAEREKVVAENARVAEEQKRKLLEEHARGIVSMFPTWDTQEKFTSGVQGIHDFLVSEGFPRDMAAQVTDPKIIKIAYMASRYKQAKARAGSKNAPRVSAPTGRPRTQTATDLSKIREQFRKSGSPDDAVELLKATRNRRR